MQNPIWQHEEEPDDAICSQPPAVSTVAAGSAEGLFEHVSRAHPVAAAVALRMTDNEVLSSQVKAGSKSNSSRSLSVGGEQSSRHVLICRNLSIIVLKFSCLSPLKISLIL